jgi:DNA-binding transcriptional ArsR family regulator
VVGLDGCTSRSGPLPAHAGQWRISADEADSLASLFRLLGDPTRTRMLYALVEAGELCVGDLAEVVDADESAVSHALRLLRTAGVVRNRRDGRHVYYRLDDVHVRLLLDLSREHLGHADGPGRPGAHHG